MTAPQPVTADELATIRARAEAPACDDSAKIRCADVGNDREQWCTPCLAAADTLRLATEVEQLRSEIDAWHVHTRSHPAAVGCVDDGDGKCRYCGAEEGVSWPLVRGDGPPDGVLKRS